MGKPSGSSAESFLMTQFLKGHFQKMESKGMQARMSMCSHDGGWEHNKLRVAKEEADEKPLEFGVVW